MRFLITGDTHFGKLRNGKLSEYTFNAFSRVIDEAISHRIDYIIVAGDIFNRSKPKLKVMEKANELFYKVLENDIGLILIPGNHDRGKLQYPLYYYFNPCSDKFHIVNSIEYLKFDKFQLMLIPYTKNWPKDIINAINTPTVIICHETFHGAKFGPQRYTFTNYKDNAIQIKNYNDNLKLIFSGHIHEAQELKHEIPVIYTGSLERLSFAEIYDRKGFYILEDFSYTFHNFETKSDLRVIEIDGNQKNLYEINYQLKLIIKNDHDKSILVRIINRKMKIGEFRYLRSGFPYNIRIIPDDEKVLKQLYSLPSIDQLSFQSIGQY